MKKMINGKKRVNLKKIVVIIIIIIFLLYTSLVLLISSRRYFFIEKIFKNVSASINTFFINNCYSYDKYYSNNISSRIRYLEKENDSLRNEINISKKENNYLVSEVVNHKSMTWFDTIIINNGYKKNVKNDLPVINSNGLIGFISKTGRNFSEVKLLTSLNNVPVLIETKDGIIPGILSSYDSKKDLFKITNVINKNSISTGNNVTLSGYENNLYTGIYVGRVVKEENSNYGLSKTIWVESNVDFNDLLFVSVVIEK